MAGIHHNPYLRIEALFALIWVFQVYLGLYFQSLYPNWLTQFAVISTIVLLGVVTEIDRLYRMTLVWVGVAGVVAMAMPTLFSQMPVLSYSWSFYLLAGAFAFLAMRSRIALAIFSAMVLYALVDTFFAFYQMLYLDNTRPGGLFMDSNARAIYVLASILFVFWRLSDAKISNGAKTVFLWILLLVLMAGFHSAQSRAMLALGGLSLASLWLYAILMSPDHRRPVVGITVAAVVGFLIFYAIFQFIPSGGLAFLNKPEGPDVRLEMWGTAWQLIKEHPFVGHGFGLFLYLYPSVRTEMGTAGHFVHNDFLEHWLASGIPGLVLTLIPVIFFTFRFFKSFISAQYQQTLFAGLGLCLMGYAFFNYFFWRLENLIVLAAVWKLAEDSRVDSDVIKVAPKHKVIALLIFLLPIVSLLAKVDQQSVIKGNDQGFSNMVRWSDWVLTDESPLIPHRIRWNFIQALNGKSDEIDFENFSQLIAQLDSEIARGTLYPAFYCARAEVGYLLQETYEETLAYIEMSERLDPFNIYCAYARFNLNVAHDKPEMALKQIYTFFNKKLSMQKADAIINLNAIALEFAEKQQADHYVGYFTQYGEYLKNRKLELGL